MEETRDASESFMKTDNLKSHANFQECVQKRLNRSIINKNDLFWPDPTTAHYGQIVVDYVHKKNADFVENEGNARNVPYAPRS
jgi:hypothetical protein